MKQFLWLIILLFLASCNSGGGGSGEEENKENTTNEDNTSYYYPTPIPSYGNYESVTTSDLNKDDCDTYNYNSPLSYDEKQKCRIISEIYKREHWVLTTKKYTSEETSYELSDNTIVPGTTTGFSLEFDYTWSQFTSPSSYYDFKLVLKETGEVLTQGSIYAGLSYWAGYPNYIPTGKYEVYRIDLDTNVETFMFSFSTNFSSMALNDLVIPPEETYNVTMRWKEPTYFVSCYGDTIENHTDEHTISISKLASLMIDYEKCDWAVSGQTIDIDCKNTEVNTCSFSNYSILSCTDYSGVVTYQNIARYSCTLPKYAKNGYWYY